MATKSRFGPDAPRIELTRSGVDYLIRPCEAGDGAGFLSLMQTITGSDRGESWFRRTYIENPYLDHVPLFVAETDGTIVGARPFTAFRVQSGDERVLALLTRDTMVHPDHQRRGLFTEMTKLALQYYTSRDVAFFFSHSNRKSLPGYEKLGWEPLGGRETYIRVQDARTFVSMRTRDLVTSVLSPVASPLSSAYLTLRDRSATSPEYQTVTKYDDIPAELLAALFQRKHPETPHIVRDEAFYRWRFRNPEWQPNTTYIARQDGTPLAGVVTHTFDGRVTSGTAVVDVVPRTGGEKWQSAIASILDAILADHETVDSVHLSEPVFPARLLVERGFLPTSRLPLSVLSAGGDLTLAVRPLNDGILNGHESGDAALELWSVAG